MSYKQRQSFHQVLWRSDRKCVVCNVMEAIYESGLFSIKVGADGFWYKGSLFTFFSEDRMKTLKLYRALHTIYDIINNCHIKLIALKYFTTFVKYIFL